MEVSWILGSCFCFLGLERSFIYLLVFAMFLFVGKDFICVASMDGMLSFFEQEMFAFGRFLPGFLLPSPARYIAKTDSFVTCSSSRLVECYKYVPGFDSLGMW